MRILVISDIHANITALEAVLADAGEVDENWCLGDIVGYGPDPNECVVLVDIAKTVAPAQNEQATAEAILSDKSLQEKFRAAVALQWKDVEPFFQFEEESREKARGFADRMTASDGPEWRQIGFGVLIGIMSLTIIVGGGAMFWNLMSSPQLDPGQKGLILGALIASFTTVVGYFFGSSATSRQKDQIISEQAKK